MRTFKKLTGKELLEYVGSNDSAVEVRGSMAALLPCQLINGEYLSSSKDDATHISVKPQYGTDSVVVI